VGEGGVGGNRAASSARDADHEALFGETPAKAASLLLTRSPRSMAMTSSGRVAVLAGECGKFVLVSAGRHQ